MADKEWAKSIPEWLLDEIKEERITNSLISILKPDFCQIGSAEVAAYLMTASFKAPLNYHYSEIFVFLTAQLMKRRGKFLDDIMEKKLKDGLTRQEKQELEELRQEIYHARGGDIDHPLFNALRSFKKRCDKESARKHPRLI